MKFQRLLMFVVTALLPVLLIPSKSNATSLNIAGLRLNKTVQSMKQIRNKHIINQSLDFSCGAAGLSTLLNYYYDDPTSEQDIIQALLKITPLQKVKARNGFSLFDLKKYVEAKGYKATGYKMDVDFLEKLGKPALVPIKFKNYRHFVIVKGIISGRVFLADPAAGNVSMKTSRFEKIWTNGIGLVLEHENADQEALLAAALNVEKRDLKVVDQKRMNRLMNQTPFRTAIYPTEY